MKKKAQEGKFFDEIVIDQESQVLWFAFCHYSTYDIRICLRYLYQDIFNIFVRCFLSMCCNLSKRSS